MKRTPYKRRRSGGLECVRATNKKTSARISIIEYYDPQLIRDGLRGTAVGIGVVKPIRARDKRHPRLTKAAGTTFRQGKRITHMLLSEEDARMLYRALHTKYSSKK